MSPNRTLERLRTHISWALLVLHVVARYGLDICQARELFGLDKSAHRWRCRYARGYLSVPHMILKMEGASLTEWLSCINSDIDVIRTILCYKNSPGSFLRQTKTTRDK